MKQLLLLAGSFVVGSLSAQAQLVFSEGFESYAVAAGTGVTVQTPNTFGPWSVTAGSIDILDTYPGLAPRTGVQNLDMDGSTNSAGTITRTFTATAGVTYTLTYYYAGNQRSGSADSMTVSLGSTSTTHSNIPSGQAYTLSTLTWTAPTTGSANVAFAHAGGDNVGLLLDDVVLVGNASGVPTLSEWGMIGLTALLILFGSLKAQRVNA